MVRDVGGAIATLSGNVEAMEVVANVLYIRFRIHAPALDELRSLVALVPGVKRLEVVQKLPFEEDEARLVRRMMNQDDAVSDLSFVHIVSASKAMQQVVELAKKAAKADMPVLIFGESGTGKELLARAIHNSSPRRDRRFVPVNCAAVPDALMESEMFGYADGAFTGAVKGGKPGMFEVADGGTLFLDEVGELPSALQAKLLRALAEGEIRRVGETRPIHVDVRIVAATNRDLTHMVNASQFRADLFYRLNGIPLYVPPLRERKEDILPMADHFLQHMVRKLEHVGHLTDRAKEQLLSYSFPGNVRELQNLMERACYLSGGEEIDVRHLWLHPVAPSPSYDSPSSGSLKEQVANYERQVIEQAVKEHGSLRAAAKHLGVTHTTLSNKLRMSDRGNGQ